MYPYIYIILPSYMVFAFIGGFSALLYIYFCLERYHIEFTVFLKLFALCVVGGVVGSKLLFALTQIPWLMQNFTLQNLVLLIPQSGYVYYGGLFGVLFTLFLCTKKNKERRKNIFQMIAPAIPLFHGFGRIGCFFAGCCYGKVLEVPISVAGILVFERIPTQLIEAAYEFILFVVLIILRKKRPELDILKSYLIGYAVFRFVNEFFRDDFVRGIFWGISTAQWVSIIIILFYSIKYINKKCKSAIV